MKPHKSLLLLLVITNVGLLAYFLFLRFGVYATAIDDCKQNWQTMYHRLEQQKMIVHYQMLTELSAIPSHSKLISEKFDTILLSTLISRPILVLRYTEIHCQSCVDAIIEQVKQIHSLGQANIMIFTWYSHPEYLYQFKRMSRLQIPVYNIRYTSLPADTLNIPYFFVLHQNMRASNVFIPDEGETTSVGIYLHSITNHLLQWDTPL